MDTFTAKEQIARFAGGQQGLIHWRQLAAAGVPSFTVSHWVDHGYLIKILPRVYAVGHTAPSREADLWAAILYAGPGAMLSHETAGHQHRIVDEPPPRIEVSTPRRIRSTTDIHVYSERRLDRAIHRGIPTTTIAQTALDIAAVAPERVLRRALSQLDFRRELELDQLLRICGHGKQGSVALRGALDTHDARYAQANGRLEHDFLELLKPSGLPLPQFGQWIDGIKVDAHWPEHNLVVELDGVGNHTTPAQLRRDRANELQLRQCGLEVIRYDWHQVHDPARPVVVELQRRLSRRLPTSSGLAG